MVDYYSVLAQAVVNLDTGEAAAREELYERARSIIVVELRRQNPRISALTITREQAALEAAILLGAMAVLVCLLVPLSRTVFRKLRLYSRSTVAVMR